MIEKVKVWCESKKLLQTGDAIVIACSGGPDSLALTDILLKLREEYALTLAAAHLEHGIRGESSKADAAFVRAFCRERGVPYFEKSVDVPQFARRHSLSLEDAARKVRYQFFYEVAKDCKKAKIATGHHQGDQAETVLLHLFRGAGSAGLAGIRPGSCGIIRPLLAVSRLEIEAYCRAEHLEPRLDETNMLLDYTRNKIRLSLLPQLSREYNSSLKEALCRTAELIGAEHDFIRACGKKSFLECTERRGGKLVFRRNELNGLHLAVKREVFRLAVEEMRGHLREISFSHIERMLKFAAEGKTGAKLELPGGLVLRCAYDKLHFTRAERPDEGVRDFVPVVLPVPGSLHISALGLNITAEISAERKRAAGKHQIVCDGDKISLPVLLRTRQSGDRFRPSGMGGGKKLKDFFIDNKIAREKRDQALLFCDQNEIFWVGGIRQNESSKVSDDTKKFFIFTIGEDEGK